MTITVIIALLFLFFAASNILTGIINFRRIFLRTKRKYTGTIMEMEDIPENVIFIATNQSLHHLYHYAQNVLFFPEKGGDYDDARIIRINGQPLKAAWFYVKRKGQILPSDSPPKNAGGMLISNQWLQDDDVE
jgi:hypothetical protein